MTQTIAGTNGVPGGSENPLRAGVASSRITDPCNVVFFGASGDLVKRMLMPAMYNLRLEDILPANYGILGFSRSAIRDRIESQAKEHNWNVHSEQLVDRQLVRRIILKRVVYGVDKNPMAVELAKLSLWLRAPFLRIPSSAHDAGTGRG